MRLNRSNLRFTIYDLRAARDSRSASRTTHHASRSGVALVITVVMISIITFLAVAFLTLTGRERGSVRTAIDATATRNATDVANDRARVEIIAAILATTNIANIDLLVSTNFVNWNGFDPLLPGGFAQLLNVNYDYQNDVGQTPLTTDHHLRNQTNLFYNARPPVYITIRLTGGYEFRYYIDLNRNGRFENTGRWPVTNLNGTFYATDGTTNPVFTPPNILSNYITGDPQWIGVLDRSDKTHSADNQFVARYAYIVVPEGKTLDVNYIHNSALTTNKPRMQALGVEYSRNQGVGTWEMNLAAFLHDMNTNEIYGWGNDALGNGGYKYDPVNGVPAGGNAFADAFGFYRYQLNGPPVLGVYNSAYTPEAFGITYGNAAANIFRRDQVDGYSDGPLQTAINYAPEPPVGNNPDDPRTPWVGANRPFHFFTTQDLFDPNKVNRGGIGLKFTDRLYAASTNLSTYDQTTFYRMLSQLGVDSSTEDEDKLNLNYVNVGGLKVTNFVSWLDSDIQAGNPARGIPQFNVPGSVLFFTNAVDRLLRETSTEWFRAGPSNYLVTFFGYYGYTGLDEVGLTNRPYFGMTNQVPTLSMTNLPVMWEGGNYVYSPSLTRTGNRQFAYNQAVHRLLQVAANIWDTKINSRALQGLPTVFRPVFRLQGNSLFITNFVEETSSATIALKTQNRPILDIFATTNLTGRIPVDGNVLIYGVPPVVGARKGLPNFNEFNSEPILTMTRKLQVRKAGFVIEETNQLFTMSLTMPSAVEFWNSYAANYARAVSVFVTNYTTLVITNDLGVNLAFPYTTGAIIPNTNNWRGYIDGRTDSLIVMMRTNVPFLTNRVYVPDQGANGLKPLTPVVYDKSKNFLMPRWGVTISNRVHAMIVDESTKEIIDYVLLGNMVYQTNWTDALCKPKTVGGGGQTAADGNIYFQLLWATNDSATVPGRLACTNGVASQIYISLGQAGDGIEVLPNGWKRYADNQTTDTVIEAINKFKTFYSTTFFTNETREVPFSPSVQLRVPMRWEANDPLVHYMSDDLFYRAKSGDALPISPSDPNPQQILKGIGAKNDRYRPWPSFTEKGDDEGDTEAIDEFNPSIKDPLVRRSDDWSFPTNTLPTVGWLGRIHRGTPWQTVYLKAANLGLGGAANSMTNWLIHNDQSPQVRWANHAGSTVEASFYNRPVVDHVLFDVFTTALNENSTRGQLPINQTGLASWSAVFSGMVALTNIGIGAPLFSPLIIQPAGSFDLANPAAPVPPLVRIVSDINATRGNTNLFPHGSFTRIADILNVPSLSFGDAVFVADNVTDPFPRQGTYYWTNESPFLNFGVKSIRGRSDSVPVPKSPEIQNTLNDAAYEWLPQQAMSLLQLGKPRFVIYAYGQSLQPAPNSIVTASGPFFGLCTNYTITAEQVTRTVVEIKGTAKAPRVEVKSYNILGPD